MKPNIQRGIKICFTIVGTSIGAGFASGREIWEFFGSYGAKSTGSLLFSIVLFAVCSMIILWISWKQGTDHYYDILKLIMGKRIASYFDSLILLFLFSSSLVMVAGSGAIFAQWDIPFVIGTAVLALAVWAILFRGLNGLMSLNYFLMPALITILIIVCMSFLLYGDMASTTHLTEIEENASAWPSAVTYAALNIIPLMAVLATMGKQITHPIEIGIAGVGSALCLGGVALLYNLSLLQIGNVVLQYDIPLFALIHSYSSIWVLIISIILWLAIYTTAISGMYGAVFRISEWVSVPHWMITLIILMLMIPLSQFGFATLVAVIYPVYGILNLFVLATVLLYPLTQSH